MSHHLQPHVLHTGLKSDNTLHVIGVISNVERYHSRYRLAREWIERTKATPNVKLHMVEAAFGDRHHELEESRDGLRLRVRTNAWIKENMINLAEKHCLPRDWKYMCWEDCDVEHRDPFWAQEALHQLQHFAAIQPWQHCSDLGAHGSIFQVHTSFGCVDQSGKQKQCKSSEPYQFAHPGFSWCMRRDLWEQVGGLIDTAVLGSADSHMSWAMIGQVDQSIHFKMHPNFRAQMHAWQNRAVRLTHREVGHTAGRIEHHFHGPKKRRYYRERWQILVDHAFDPTNDLMRDEQGVLHIVGKPALEAAIRKYNRSRQEDSIEET